MEVPFGYLITVGILALAVLFALTSPDRTQLLRSLSFWLSMVINEIPLVPALWLVASTAIACSQGDLDSTAGKLLAGLALLTLAGLAVIAIRGGRAGTSVRKALARDLGEGWSDGLDPQLMPAERRGRDRLIRMLLAPLVIRRREVRRLRNLAYGEDRRNRLDLYLPRAGAQDAPILIHAHGGHFRRGGKSRETRPLLYRLASQGWVCASINYRLSPAASFPDHVVDLKKAIAWVREHAAEYGADPRTVFVAGCSAGGHMAAMAALTADIPAFQPDFESADTSVTAAVCLYGYYGGMRSPTGLPASPEHYVRPDAPPFFIVHGDRDTVVEVEGARQFATALRQASANPVVYAELPDAQHSFDLFHSRRFEAVIDGVESFAAWVRTAQRAAA